MPSPAVDDQPRVQETTNSGTSHASPRFARKGQQIGYRCNEMPQNSSKLKQRNLPPSTEVRINTVIESVQGNMFLITQNNSEKKVTDGKQDHRVLLEDWYRFIRKTMLNTITLKANLQMSDQMRPLKRSNKTARNLPKTPIVAVIEMSSILLFARPRQKLSRARRKGNWRWTGNHHEERNYRVYKAASENCKKLSAWNQTNQGILHP